MYATIAFTFIACIIQLTSGHSQGEPRLLTSVSHVEERQHIGSHMDMMDVDINSMAEDELRFLYFKMHDSDDNSRLDGCELVKSLLHWHSEEDHSHRDHGAATKIFGHDELALMIDPILATDDRNMDGFIDYPEFVAAQKARGF